MSSQHFKGKVFVGMSGGVDSSVSAVLLKQAGYDITGVFIKVWQPDWIEPARHANRQGVAGGCNWREERLDAMRAAAHIGVPFVTLDLEKEYKKDVIDYMIAEYRTGRTPNPDVMCNRYVKFGAFWKWAESQGADFIATGHYAQVLSELDLDHRLAMGADTEKDQSYFLWTLTRSDLAHILFPVGHLTKPEVRRLANRFGLPNADKKDSQGLCFIGKIDVKEFLSHYIQPITGNVLNESGEVIGTHSGSELFTIGERRGITISKKTPHDRPYFVVDKDVEQNTITVSNKESGTILPGATKQVKISKVNWIGGSAPGQGSSPSSENSSSANGGSATYGLQARSRYRQPLQNIRIERVGITETTIGFEKPQDTLTPGQSLVIYDGEICLGGGIICG